MIEFVPFSDKGRYFEEEFVIRLGDADEEGLLRLDGLARFLQDVATDDSSSSGLVSNDTWVVRRTSVRLVGQDRWPRYLDRVLLTTWCGGVGPAWAERRTNVTFNGEVCLEAAAIWVPIDPSGHPVRIGESFFDAYGQSARGRKVSGRIERVTIPEDAMSQEWALRAADIDIVGHANNAALWQAVSEVAKAPLRSVSVRHHGSVEAMDDVTLVRAPGHLWLSVEGEVRVSADYENLGS